MIGSKKRTDIVMLGMKKRSPMIIGVKHRPMDIKAPVIQNGLIDVPRKSILEKK
jgi:hypothetical protein